ncbi:SusC/RagA family TonB-linked outer membrane protein [Phocaeicola vulgatus]|jgi:TonB-linked SusC/RagA family outer membrane protein|uniref:SusC/RagA family TonB-linked outer membrane protein n=1 Tax=Phocaeicola vulgatus TaxID=821 RepID=UPI0039B57E3B
MKNKILALTILAFTSMNAMAQEEVNVTGKVVDKVGNPVSGAAVSVLGQPLTMVSTDVMGNFTISVSKDAQLWIQTPYDAKKVVKAEMDKKMTVIMDFFSNKVNYGFGLEQTYTESTGAASTVYSDDIATRSSYTVGNSLYGNVLGLTTMQKTGTMWEQIPSMFIRGQKSLNGNNGILLVVDGLERDNAYQVLRYLTPEEVESVTVLRDAAAVALYGYKGANGVVNIVTKRGLYKKREISFAYDHGFTYQNRLPEMSDSYTYARAMNEALANDGKAAKYSQNELNAFKSGKYPYYYPNVNWWDEVFRERGSSDIATLTFRGGASKLRYYTMLNLQNGRGFYKNANENDGYSTQEKYSKANFRSNLDIDLTPKTKMQVNIMGMLNEFSRPGYGSDNLIGKLYMTPSAAFPIRTENGLWGGNATWDGYNNPVALAQGRGYSKGHTLGLWADMSLRQDLSSITKGLGASFRMGYDNVASYWEDHCKDYAYGSTVVTEWKNGEPSAFSEYTGGSDSEMKGGSKLDWQYRSFNFMANVDWKRQFGEHKVYTTLMYTYKYDNNANINSNLYHCNWSWYTHYGYKNRYFFDFALVNSASNLLETGNQWHISPTVGLAWVASNESLLNNYSWLNFLKLRASFGVINTDNIPYNGYWYETMNGSGGGYPIQDNFSNGGSWQEGQLPSINGTTEKAYKYNVGLDATLFDGLTLTADAFYEKRQDIWVYTGGKNSSILGATASYANAGVVDSKGLEFGANYIKSLGKVRFNFGGTFTLTKNKIVEQLEEPKAYEYLRATGKAVGQIFGYQAVGFFVDQSDIDDSPSQQFGVVKPGDIKYKDQNNDNVINEFDQIPLGYNSSVPEIYYSFNIGAEWKGIGVNFDFQGVGNYTSWTTLNGLYRPLSNGNAISNYYYENRWTPETPNARYPRLTTETVQNNTQSSSVWLVDGSFLKLRNCEVYYKLPHSVVNKWHLNSAKLYVRGVDLFCWDHIKEIDPESIGNGIPTTRSINIGLSVGF